MFSVHTIVSFDFATSVIPGWHTTIFPPYFVIGAIFSGFAMVITLMTFMRGYFGMKNYITLNHMEAMAKILTHPNAIIGLSDGGAHVQFHGGYGFSTRLLGEWVREKGVMSLEQAVRRLTFDSASTFGLYDRGLLRARRLEGGLLRGPRHHRFNKSTDPPRSAGTSPG